MVFSTLTNVNSVLDPKRPVSFRCCSKMGDDVDAHIVIGYLTALRVSGRNDDCDTTRLLMPLVHSNCAMDSSDVSRVLARFLVFLVRQLMARRHLPTKMGTRETWKSCQVLHQPFSRVL